MHWAAELVGSKYELGSAGPFQFDCWGLLCFVYKNRFGIDLNWDPCLSGASGVCVARAIVQSVASHDWGAVGHPDDGDAVLLGSARAKHAHHVGVYVAQQSPASGLVLHAERQAGVVADSPLKLRLRGYRVFGHYRHKQHGPRPTD